MFTPLVNIINDIALGPENRKVKQYLGKSTRNSVFEDLGRVLLPQLKAREHLQATFDRHCIEDPSSHQKYWTKESFHGHIRGTYAADSISETAIAVLWNSFFFYAYHPFSLDTCPHAKVDFDAFRRATLLTVFQCDSLLGTRELDWYWRQDVAFFRKASFARIFRSIAVPDDVSLKQQQIDITSGLSDAMDVLVMLGPQFIHAVPSEPQLESVARKLFAEGPPVARRQVMKREDVSVLIDLLLRLRLEERTWSTCCYIGHLATVESGEADLTQVLIDALTGDNSGQMITIQQLSGAITLMPNLLLRFQQLWAVLFQPLGSTVMTKLHLDEMKITSIGGVVLLFAPHINADVASVQITSNQDTHLRLDTIPELSSDSRDTSMSRLSQGLSNHSSAYVVLFTTDTNTSNTTIGAYFPIASRTPHILFQLRPRFCILRWSKPHVPRVDLIRAEERVSLSEFVANKGSKLSDNTPYWIGNTLDLGAGLRVDPKNETTTLTNSVGGCYMEIPTTREKGNSEKSWNVTIQKARMNIFTVVGARDKKI
ncbi:hypothetical protein F4803DRAFT_554568 [Xylaria telfairii]|nr:hypothetical protein F4803DRAFT_554568 [Xylaria telfairii]